jgi:multiple sugar transport system substrate-binding protein
MKRTIELLIFVFLGVILLSGCDALFIQPSPTPARSPVSTRTPFAAPTPRPQITATAAPVTDTLTLTWWTPEFVSPKAAAPVGPLLSAYLTDFEKAHNGKVRVNPVIKARYGKGGLLDFLRTAQPVAPGILPDLVVLDLAEVEQAVGLGLLQPMDSLLPREITATLYTFARQAGQFDGRTMAVPWLVDLEHAIYNRDLVSSPPSTWAGALTQGVPYVFPAGSPQSPSAAGLTDDVQHAFIAQYLSAGGTLDPKTRRLALQEQPLLRVLNFYRDASEAGLLPKSILNVTSLDHVWNVYTQEGMAMANVSARRYLANRDVLPNTSFAPAPGWSSPVLPLAEGWAVVITTADPLRQRAAADLIVWLLTAERAGALVQAAGWLPTSPKALATWGANPYFEFLDGQLTSAVAHPLGSEYTQTAARLQKAVTAVLKGAASPAEAAQAAIAPK